MNLPLSNDALVVLAILFLILGAVLLLTLILLVWAVLWIRGIDLPDHASFVDALRATPLPVVVILDLLDLTLDVFSAPFTWFLLGRLGLKPLRFVAVVKDLIPFTNFVPLMTVAWLYAQFLAERQHLLPVNSRSAVSR